MRNYRKLPMWHINLTPAPPPPAFHVKISKLRGSDLIQNMKLVVLFDYRIVFQNFQITLVLIFCVSVFQP